MAHYESAQAQKLLLHMRNDASYSDIQLKASNDEIITAHKVCYSHHYSRHTLTSTVENDFFGQFFTFSCWRKARLEPVQSHISTWALYNSDCPLPFRYTGFIRRLYLVF